MVVLALAGAISASAEDPINLDSLAREKSRRNAECIGPPYHIIPEGDTRNGVAGPVYLRVAVILNAPGDLSLTVDKEDKLQVTGQRAWSFSGAAKDTVRIVVEAMVPRNDTSSFTYTVKLDDWSSSWQAFFASADDSVTYTYYDPRVWPPRSSMRYKEIWQDFSDSLRPESSRPGGIMRIGYYDDTGGFISQDSMDLLDSIAEADTLSHWIGPRTRSKVWIPAENGGRILVDTAWLLDSLRQVKVEETTGRLTPAGRDAVFH